MTDTLGKLVEAARLADEAVVKETEEAARKVAESAGRLAVAASVEEQVSLRKQWMRRYVVLLLTADTVSALAASSAAYLSKRWVPHRMISLGYVGEHMGWISMAVVSVVSWLSVLALSGAYRSKHVAADARDYRVPLKAAIQFMAACAIGSYLLHEYLSRILMVTFFAVLAVTVVLGRLVVNLVLAFVRRQGRARARVILVGEARAVGAFADHLLSRDDTRADVIAVCTTAPGETISAGGQDLPVLGPPDDVLEAARAVSADAVIVAGPSGLTTMSLQQVSWQLERNRVDLFVAPDTVALAGPRLKVSSLRGLPVLQVRHPEHDGLLRNLDFHLSRVVALILLVVASPLLLATSLAIKLGSAGPVFYRQRRVGYKGEEFEMIKFRSMVPDADELLPSLIELNEHDGALFKIKDDPRITRVGRILRKYSLDELPQLINVVRGDMTLVGPRPCLAREMTMFGEAEHRRFMVRPGMTGLWQVSGGPGLPWAEAVKTDLYYVDNWSPALDLSILARTLRVVMAGSGC